MKKTLIFITVFIISLSFFFLISEALFAFNWSERGITEKSSDQIEEGTRVFLETRNQKPFVVVYEKNLLTDSIQEQILAVFQQIQDTYNLPVTNVEFKIKANLFQVNLILNTGMQLGIVQHGMNFSDKTIPTISSMLNEFTTWKGLILKNLQFVIKADSFQTTLIPEQNRPLITLAFASSQPRQKAVSDLAVFYNETTTWQKLQAEEIRISVQASTIEASIQGQNGKSLELEYHGTSFKPGDLTKIGRSFNAITSWQQLDYKKIQSTAKAGILDTLILLNQATYQGMDLLKNLPAGIRLVYDQELAYTFRVVSGKYYAQVSGNYSNENKLLWQINEAIKDPILYIRKYDPEFFFRQLEEIRDRNAELYRQLKADQQKSYEELLNKHENLKQAHERFIYGYITIENSGFMGTADIDAKAISRIVELKTENADLTRTQLEEQLKQENFNITSKVVDMVLSIYFNDFKK